MRSACFLLVVLALAGCGGGGSDEDQAEEAVKAYLDGLADGDGEAACERLTDGAKEELLAGLFSSLPIEEADAFGEKVGGAQISQEEASDACPEVIERIAKAAGNTTLNDLRFAEVSDVRIQEDRAFVKLEGADTVPTLEKVDGEWRIAEIGMFG